MPHSLIGPLSSTAARQAVAQGIAPLNGQIPHALVAPITHAAFLSFIDGLHAAMLVGALVAFAGALLSLVIQRGRAVEGAAAV